MATKKKKSKRSSAAPAVKKKRQNKTAGLIAKRKREAQVVTHVPGPEPKKKMGRPSGYTPEVVEQILRLAVQGPTEHQIALAIGVSMECLSKWKRQHPDLVQALKAAKEAADDSVVQSLRQRALGYSHKAVKFFMRKDGTIITKSYTEHYPPETTACIFWLKNRDKNNWRDMQKLEHSGEINTPQVLVTLPSNGREAK